jgi:hypothetical protein
MKKYGITFNIFLTLCANGFLTVPDKMDSEGSMINRDMGSPLHCLVQTGSGPILSPLW